MTRRLGLFLGVVLLATTPSLAAPQAFATADSIVQSGIRRGIYPGAVLLIGNHERVLHAQAFGRFQWNAGPAPDPDATLWDLASLTKVVGTTPAIMRLVERGKVDLDAPVVRYLPRFQGKGKDAVTVRMLLNHTSGLRSYLPFFQLARTRDSAIALLYHEPLRRPPGTLAEYSDLNFLLLGLLVEAVTGEPLETVVAREVLLPAGLTHSTYRPADSLRTRTAPTGRYRGHPVCCEVNDQNAVRMGGVAGHAGLFSTGADLARYARLWLNHGALDGHRVFTAAVVDSFLSPAQGKGDRLLGWERPDPKNRDDSAYGHLLSETAYGHTGWTGTLLWIDPKQDLFLVLLTNRSYDPRVGRSIRALRSVRNDLADQVVRTMARAAKTDR